MDKAAIQETLLVIVFGHSHSGAFCGAACDPFSLLNRAKSCGRAPDRDDVAGNALRAVAHVGRLR